MDERKKKILRAIVDEYIETAQPVSSNTIVQKYEPNISSATVRNDMAELEKIGFLEKTHTSSGRVPSAKGYRMYVDELLNYDDISLEEIEYIGKKLETKVNQLEDLTKITTSTISEVTHYTTVSVGPKTDIQRIEEIKFVMLGNRMLMAIIVTDIGMIKETIIKFDEDINQEQVDTLSRIFNKKLKGEPLEKIDKPLEEYIFNEIHYNINIIRTIINEIKKLIVDNKDFFLEGRSKSYDLPEFKSIDVARNFANVLDEKDLMLDILNNGNANDIQIYIGDENGSDELKDFSVITFKHSVGNKDLGTIGIIGPKRMNYSKIISVMKYINKYLNGNENNK